MMEKDIAENFFNNVEWFNNFFSDIGQIFKTLSDKIKKEFKLDQELQYYSKLMHQPSIPDYYCLLIGGNNSVQIFVNLTRDLLENHPYFVNEPSIIVVIHKHPRYDWVDDLGLNVLKNHNININRSKAGINSGEIKFKSSEDTLPFKAFQVRLDHFKSGENLEEIIDKNVISKLKDLVKS